MRFNDFKSQIEPLLVFSLADIRKIEPNFYRSRLNNWQKKGYITKLRRGYYIFTGTIPREEALLVIANRLYSPSYVSFETALSRYGLIPEAVYSITSASTKKTSAFKSPVANFIYHRIKPGSYFGYRLERFNDRNYKIAEMEKAVLDYLYINPRIVREADFQEWRFNSREFMQKADLAKLRTYAAAYDNKQQVKRVEKLLKLLRSAS